MDIKLKGNYVITSDNNQFILSKVLVKQKSSEEYYSSVGFYGSLEHALNAYTKNVILQSEATSIKELLDELASIKQYLKESIGI